MKCKYYFTQPLGVEINDTLHPLFIRMFLTALNVTTSSHLTFMTCTFIKTTTKDRSETKANLHEYSYDELKAFKFELKYTGEVN